MTEFEVDKEAPLPDGYPKIHAKHYSIIVSAGTEDRDRTFEEMQQVLEDALRDIPGVKRVIASGYYILDGKVCKPDDYDPETQNFKAGTHPPPWAGGPVVHAERPKREPVGFSPAEPRKTKKVEKSEIEDKVEDGLDAALEAVRAAKAKEEV
jgi:hypothetical protein